MNECMKNKAGLTKIAGIVIIAVLLIITIWQWSENANLKRNIENILSIHTEVMTKLKKNINTQFDVIVDELKHQNSLYLNILKGVTKTNEDIRFITKEIKNNNAELKEQYIEIADILNINIDGGNHEN